VTAKAKLKGISYFGNDCCDYSQTELTKRRNPKSQSKKYVVTLNGTYKEMWKRAEPSFEEKYPAPFHVFKKTLRETGRNWIDEGAGQPLLANLLRHERDPRSMSVLQ